jgi:hypothetical protein
LANRAVEHLNSGTLLRFGKLRRASR